MEDAAETTGQNQGGIPGQFPPTRWTRVVAANGDGAEAERALNELCGMYWYPLYAFVRRKGKGAVDAQDLTQGFLRASAPKLRRWSGPAARRGVSAPSCLGR